MERDGQPLVLDEDIRRQLLPGDIADCLDRRYPAFRFRIGISGAIADGLEPVKAVERYAGGIAEAAGQETHRPGGDYADGAGQSGQLAELVNDPRDRLDGLRIGADRRQGAVKVEEKAAGTGGR